MALTIRTQVAVVGGGITGLAAMERLAAVLPPSDVLLLEGEPRLGGKIVTERTDGCLIEGGPDCFLATRAEGMDFCREMGIADRLVGVPPEFRRSFIRRGRELHELPEGLTGLVPSRLGPLLTTRVLSPLGRARAALELVVPRRRREGDESVAAFVRRRFGREAYAWMVEPLLGGVFAGDGEKLSLDATFPQLRETERTRGSLLGAMLRDRTPAAPTNGGPARGFVAPADGMAGLVAAVVSRLPADRLWTGIAVRQIIPTGYGFLLELEDGRAVEAERVVLTAPAHAASALLAKRAPDLAQALGGIPFASSATVTLAFRRTDVPRLLPGTGYVSPRVGGTQVVACTWVTHKFAGRAPDDVVLLRFFVGRAGMDALVAGDDRAILDAVQREAKEVLSVGGEPILHRIFRWPRGLPQYTLGHRERLERIAALAAEHPGLILAGASYRGVGVPDCIGQGRRAAAAALGMPRG